MYYKCELVIGGCSYDVTDNLVNWDDVEMSFKRNDYDGVVRSFSTKFQFANGAYSLLLKQYTDNYLKSNASIVFYIRNNSWLWNEKFRCALDFSTFSYNGTTCEINAVDNSLASLIKAKKGTQYEYPVDELTENEPLYYDRLQMSNEIKWIIPSESEDNSISKNITIDSKSYYSIPLYLYGTPEITVKDIVEVGDVEEIKTNLDEIPVFFKNTSKKSINIHLKVKFHINFGNPTPSYGYPSCFFYLLKREVGGNHANEFDLSMKENGLYTISIDKDITLKSGESLKMVFEVVREVEFSVTWTLYDMDTYLTITFYAKDIPVNIDLIKPLSLLNRLLKSINGEKEGITCEIASGVDSRLDNTLIVAAESIRGLDNAKIYTSYSKFADWMKSEFGFVPVVGENKVAFVHRDSLFQNVQIKDFADNSREFEYTVNSSLIYSGIKVGYDKQDYDSVNGRDEFHFTNEYSTGITLTDNVLDLISPYRADAYGIEFLAAKRGEDTTDSKSDNDIFFVGAELSGDKYELIRIPISGVISPDTMFNAMYSQHHMIKANEKFIGAFTDRLEFASSEGNSDVVIDGVSEKADILISERSFTVGELSFETGDTEIPSDLSGYVVVTNGGKTYKGYLSNVSYNLGRSEAVKYTLIAKEAQ